MKEVKKIKDEQLYLKAREIVKIGNEAVSRAKAENEYFNLPEFFVKNGILYFQLKSGEITTQGPFENL